MDSRLEFVAEPKQGYLYVQVTGLFERERFKAILAMVAQRCRLDERHRVMVDLLGQTGGLEAIDQHDAGVLIPQVYSRECWVAFVVSEESVPQYRFLETVALNRGASFRVFTTLKDAGEWLSKPSTLPETQHV